jgi:ABC-type branched-subunit amino acid transport system ATPase component
MIRGSGIVHSELTPMTIRTTAAGQHLHDALFVWIRCPRALPNPKYLMLDEPFAGVDPIAISDLQYMIGCMRDFRLGVLVSDHNVREVRSWR